MVTVSECASHVVADAAMGGVAGKGAGEQSLARKLYRRLDEDWLLIAGRNFFNRADWCTAADSGAQLLWRGKAGGKRRRLALTSRGGYSHSAANPTRGGAARAGGHGVRGRPGARGRGARRLRPGRGG